MAQTKHYIPKPRPGTSRKAGWTACGKDGKRADVLTTHDPLESTCKLPGCTIAVTDELLARGRDRQEASTEAHPIRVEGVPPVVTPLDSKNVSIGGQWYSEQQVRELRRLLGSALVTLQARRAD